MKLGAQATLQYRFRQAVPGRRVSIERSAPLEPAHGKTCPTRCTDSFRSSGPTADPFRQRFRATTCRPELELKECGTSRERWSCEHDTSGHLSYTMRRRMFVHAPAR